MNDLFSSTDPATGLFTAFALIIFVIVSILIVRAVLTLPKILRYTKAQYQIMQKIAEQKGVDIEKIVAETDPKD